MVVYSLLTYEDGGVSISDKELMNIYVAMLKNAGLYVRTCKSI